MTDRRDTRVYPTCCTSAFCGRVECIGCPNLPVLTRFQAWKTRTHAEPADPIWSPNVYHATNKGDTP